ncbi:DNA primase family protein [Pacificoceanicola onchidii]|uniref:DNA primase family protein n=1 Tax=Pacificoceanicola onchidii TaxID=2562685 RepID=UPI0014561738|nr:DNA primase family protein [Pacificoceanicola onchidii]
MTGNIDDVRKTFDAAEDISPAEGLAPPDDGGHMDGPPPRTPDDFGGYSDPDDDQGPSIEGARLPLNDTGNGSRFALYCGDHAMYVPRVGWHIWDEKRWKLDPDGIAVRRHAQSIQRRIIEEIPHVVLEDWQLEQIERESIVRPRLDQLRLKKAMADKAGDGGEKLTVEEEIELDDLDQQMKWIHKLKDRRAGMKSDHRSFAKSTGNKGRIDALLTEATTSLGREVEDLDADPLTVNTESGILRFRVTDLRPESSGKVADVEIIDHAREVPVEGRNHPQFITKLMPAEFDRHATCPRFDAFMRRVQPDPEMRAFLQRWWGLCMTATPVQKFVFQYGKGANGKSVLSDLMNRLLGDYATTVKIKSLTGRNNKSGADATPDLMPLVGARAALASEPEEGDRLQEGMIKEMTGGEPILVRQLHSDFIEVRPYFKLTISGNHKPDIRGTDDGIWRRVLLVPFDVQIPEAERDEKLIDKLWEERAGILNWLIEGLMAFLEGGLQEPDQVLEATQDYRADSDPIGTFLAECCVVSGASDDFLSARELIDGFNLWMDQRGEGMWGQRTVSLKFKAEAGRYRDPTTNRPFTKGKRDVTGYRGICFTDMFRRAYDDAPRNNQGRPVAFTASSGGSSSSGEDYTT